MKRRKLVHRGQNPAATPIPRTAASHTHEPSKRRRTTPHELDINAPHFAIEYQLAQASTSPIHSMTDSGDSHSDIEPPFYGPQPIWSNPDISLHDGRHPAPHLSSAPYIERASATSLHDEFHAPEGLPGLLLFEKNDALVLQERYARSAGMEPSPNMYFA